MLALQDEHVNMFEATQEQRERQLSIEAHHQQLQEEVSSSSSYHQHEQMILNHLRGKVAFLRGTQLQAAAELQEMEARNNAEAQVYQMEIADYRMKQTHSEYETKIAKEAIERLQRVGEESIQKMAAENQRMRKAYAALVEANTLLKKGNPQSTPMFGMESDDENVRKIKDLERLLSDMQKDLLGTKSDNAKLKVELHTARALPGYGTSPHTGRLGSPTPIGLKVKKMTETKKNWNTSKKKQKVKRWAWRDVRMVPWCPRELHGRTRRVEEVDESEAFAQRLKDELSEATAA